MARIDFFKNLKIIDPTKGDRVLVKGSKKVVNFPAKLAEKLGGTIEGFEVKKVEVQEEVTTDKKSENEKKAVRGLEGEEKDSTDDFDYGD